MTIVLTDTFTEAIDTLLSSHIADTGQSWNATTSQVVSNVLLPTDSFPPINCHPPFVTQNQSVQFSPAGFYSGGTLTNSPADTYGFGCEADAMFVFSLRASSDGSTAVNCNVFNYFSDTIIQFTDSDAGESSWTTITGFLPCGNNFRFQVGSDNIGRLFNVTGGDVEIATSNYAYPGTITGTYFYLFTTTGATCIDNLVLSDIGSIAPPNAPTGLDYLCLKAPDAIIPELNITIWPNSGIAPFTMQANVVISYGTGSETWYWDFGDGTSSTDKNATHVYEAGSWTAKLTVTNAFGSWDYERPIVVFPKPVETGYLENCFDINVSTKTIHRSDAGSFLTDGFKAGDKIVLPGRVGFFTIVSVTDKDIIVLEAIPGITVTGISGNIFVTLTTAYATGGFSPIHRLSGSNGFSITPSGSVYGETIASLLGQIGYYIVDTPNDQIKICGTNGELLKAFGGPGSEVGKFHSPTTCAVINGRQGIDRAFIEKE